MTSSRGVARIGVLVPFTNTNLEPDLQLLRPDGVSLHFSRLGGYDADEVPDESQMAGLGTSDLSEPLRLLLGVKPDLVMYGCTSATLTHGPDFDRELAAEIERQSGAKTVTAAGALLHALQSIDAKQVAFASPYVPAINDRAVAFLDGSGIKTVSRADFDGVLDNTGQGAVTPDEVIALAKRADSKAAEALVLSCTDMRSVEAVEQLEAELAKPVVCSNQAMMRHARDLLGLVDGPACGRLLAA